MILAVFEFKWLRQIIKIFTMMIIDAFLFVI